MFQTSAGEGPVRVVASSEGGPARPVNSTHLIRDAARALRALDVSDTAIAEMLRRAANELTCG
jgi:hypothetical protein